MKNLSGIQKIFSLIVILQSLSLIYVGFNIFQLNKENKRLIKNDSTLVKMIYSLEGDMDHQINVMQGDIYDQEQVIEEQKEQIEDQESKINDQENQIDNLENQ